jgi:hypothetical protein
LAATTSAYPKPCSEASFDPCGTRAILARSCSATASETKNTRFSFHCYSHPEQRAALAEAKERALTLALERRELAQESRRLRAQLRECTQRLETERSQPGSETP